jgi:hypothetical protein
MASPDTSTSLALSAVFDLNGVPIPVNTGNLLGPSKSFVFVLSQPVPLGDGLQFVDWLHDTVHIPLTSDDVTRVIDAIPHGPNVPVLPLIHDILLNFLHLIVTIQSVKIDTGNGVYSFVVTLTEPRPVHLFAGLSFDSVGIAVSFGGTPASPTH